MPYFRLTVFLPAFALAAISPSALAQGETPPRLKLDANQNGLIELTEFIAGADARFAKMDQNGDGQITPDEHRAFRDNKRAQHRARRFSRLDTDGNGLVSKAEFEAADQGRMHKHRRGGRRAGFGMRPRMMGAPNNAGTAQTRPAMDKARFEARARQRFARMDKNGDGALDPTELRRPHRRR